MSEFIPSRGNVKIFSSSGIASANAEGKGKGCGKEEITNSSFSYDNRKKPSFNFSYNDANNWTANFDAPAIGSATAQSQKEDGLASSIGFNASNENGTCKVEDKKFTITGNYLSDISNEQTKISDKTIINYVITLIPYEDRYTAYIEPIDGWDKYKKWLPEGPDPKVAGTTGDSVLFGVYYKDKNKPNEKITIGIRQVRYFFKFKEISNVPGYAMNYPSEKIDKKADLQLGKTGEEPDTSKEVTDFIITTEDNPSMQVKVESFDYGAFGKLRAFVTLITGEVLEATDPNSKNSFVTIPYCSKENSAIADSWKESEKATGQLDTDDDENKDKLGNNKFRGDGYSLYEEYRGFIENGKHIRTSALKKDVMVCDKVREMLKNQAAALPDKDIRKKSLGGRSQDGINIFMDVTGFVVHSGFKDEEFGINTEENVYVGHQELNTLQLPLFTSSKIMNFNSWDEKTLHEQTGILMLPSPQHKGFAAAYPKNSNPVRPPSTYYCLVITADFDPNPEGYSSINGDITHDGGIIVNPDGQAKIITDEYAVTVAHEMLHYCNVKHHGDKREKEYIFFSGKDVEGGDASRVYMKEADSKLKVVSKVDIYLDDANGTPVKGTDKMFDITKNWKLKVSVQQGTCSGVEDCIMRYDDGRVFIKDGKYYLTLQTLRGGYSELTGLTLCDSVAGTGVNDSSHKPRSRYGDADAGRGNCKAQVCINDKYK